MARGKKHTPEQAVKLVRQIEEALANGKMTAQSCKEAEITKRTHERINRCSGIRRH
jgi:hypothetical protein